MNESRFRIMMLRSKLELTQQEFAEKCGISESSLNLLECGRKSLTLRTAKKICDKTDVNLSWILCMEKDVILDFLNYANKKYKYCMDYDRMVSIAKKYDKEIIINEG